jgi:CRISPR-associated exonuclease Cas4
MTPSERADNDYLTVNDLKNHIHCPRFPYYENCLPDVRPRTYKMDAGEEAHVRERERARRRTLSAYGLPAGERLFNVRIQCPLLGLSGELDELVISEGVYLPVDYKLSHRANDSFAVQVAAYALLVESHFQTRVETAYIYLIPLRTMYPVAVTAALRGLIVSSLESIRATIRSERMPPPPPKRAICRDCEFRRFCNDV